MDYQVAQLNIAELLEPLDSPRLKGFVDNLERINRLADEAPGFVWRLQTDEGDATQLRPFDDNCIVNMSVWQDVESLHNYVYRSVHVEIMRGKKQWFAKMAQAHSVLWWVPAGHRPDVMEAKQRLELLRESGPGPGAFTFKKAHPKPSEKLQVPNALEGTCPAE